MGVETGHRVRDQAARHRLDQQAGQRGAGVHARVHRGVLVWPLVCAQQDQRTGGTRIAVTAVEQIGQPGERVISTYADHEAHRLSASPGGCPAGRLQQRDQIVVVNRGDGVEHARTPPRGDGGMDRDRGVGQPIGRYLRHLSQATGG